MPGVMDYLFICSEFDSSFFSVLLYVYPKTLVIDVAAIGLLVAFERKG